MHWPIYIVFVLFVVAAGFVTNIMSTQYDIDRPKDAPEPNASHVGAATDSGDSAKHAVSKVTILQAIGLRHASAFAIYLSLQVLLAIEWLNAAMPPQAFAVLSIYLMIFSVIGALAGRNSARG